MLGFSPQQHSGMQTSTSLEQPVQGSTIQTVDGTMRGAGGGQQTGAGSQQTGAGSQQTGAGSQHGSQQGSQQSAFLLQNKPADAGTVLQANKAATQQAIRDLRNIFHSNKTGLLRNRMVGTL